MKDAGEVQARLCRENGSPTYEAVLRAVNQGGNVADELLRADGGDPMGTALHLRLLGAVHRLAMTDEACPLRRWYPSTGGTVDLDAVVPAFLDVVAAHRERLAVDMRAPVQTNEVGRSAPLSAALQWVVARLGGPLRLLEVGASAGLNLWLDRYRVAASDCVAWGPPDSPVQLLGHFEAGAPTPVQDLHVVERRGCDRHPLDASDPDTRLLLRSFVWPEQTDRLARLDAALSAAGPVTIDDADACDWVAARLADLPGDATTVVFHSIVMLYLRPEDRARFARTIRDAGRAGGRLAWVAMEPSTASYDEVHVTAEVWPPGERWRLATTTPHGLRIRWNPTTRPTIPGA